MRKSRLVLINGRPLSEDGRLKLYERGIEAAEDLKAVLVEHLEEASTNLANFLLAIEIANVLYTQERGGKLYYVKIVTKPPSAVHEYYVLAAGEKDLNMLIGQLATDLKSRWYTVTYKCIWPEESS